MRVLAIVACLCVIGAGPCLAETSAECEARLADLTKRVELLERRLAAMRLEAAKPAAPATTPAPVTPKAPPASAAAPAPTAQTAGQQGQGREEALALYGRIDQLVASGKVAEANRELAAWDESHAGTPAAGWTRALNRELAVVGKAAPADWAIERWFQGEQQVTLDGQRPTLLVFWEAWCPHCKTEVPKLQQLAKDYASKGLQVVGVTRITQTATEESVRGFLTESGVSYPIAKETGALAEYFDVKGIPAAALVKDGKVVWRGHPVRLTPDLLTSLL